MMRTERKWVSVLAVLLLVSFVSAEDAGQGAPASNQSKIGDFSFIQITDIHISPHPDTLKQAPSLRGEKTISWICEEADKPQVLDVFGQTAPTPAFCLATGDLSEYGFIDKTYDDFEKAFKGLDMPMYMIAGNHDNTWHSMTPILREKYEKNYYAFEKFGYWFIGLNSATPQEPVPSFSAKSIRWLREKLGMIGKDKPVFLFLHHPVDSGEFAPAEWGLLYEVIRSYNVVAILYGHGHSVQHKVLNGIDCIMGGTTFDKGKTPEDKQRAGYMIYWVKDGMLRIAYRYHSAARPMVALLEKSIRPAKRNRIDANIAMLEYNTPRANGLLLSAKAVPVEGPAPKLVMKVDGKPVEYSKAKRGRLKVSLDGIEPGGHVLEVTVDDPEAGKAWETRYLRFFKKGDAIQRDWIRSIPDSAKAGPLLHGDKVLTATMDGTFMNRVKSAPYSLWEYQVDGELLTTPVPLFDDFVVFGAGNGKVYGINARVEEPDELWQYDAGAPVHGQIAVAPLEITEEGHTYTEEYAYFGDNRGRLHAISAVTGLPMWVFERADYGIEGKPAVTKDSVYFGAWDGYVYALDRATGKLKWKKPSPKRANQSANRYYGPSDCGPIIVGDRLFVCDRGYCLAPYSFDGEMGELIAKDVAAIVPAEDGKSFFARCTGDRVARYDAEGKLLWEAKVPAGRFPIPPTEKDGKLYICSNTGMLSVLDAATGKLIWKYQVTPGFYVMAPVAVDDNGICIVLGMDGVIYAVGPVEAHIGHGNAAAKKPAVSGKKAKQK